MFSLVVSRDGTNEQIKASESFPFIQNMSLKGIREINSTVFRITQRIYFELIKKFCLFPFVYDKKLNCFTYSDGFRLLYITLLVGFQIGSTLVVLWLNLYRATVMSSAASREVAHLAYLFAVFVYHSSILLLCWIVYKHQDKYLKIVNDLNSVYRGLLKMGINLQVTDNYLEYAFTCLLAFDSFSILISFIYFTKGLYRAGLLSGLGIIEPISMFFVAFPLTFSICSWSSVNFLVAHFISVIRLKVNECLRRLNKSGKRSFEFDELCLEASDLIGQLSDFQAALHATVLSLEELVGKLMAVTLFNAFVAIISNVSPLPQTLRTFFN